MKPSLYPIIGFLALASLPTRKLMEFRPFDESKITQPFDPPIAHGRQSFSINGKKIISYSLEAAKVKYAKKYLKS